MPDDRTIDLNINLLNKQILYMMMFNDITKDLPPEEKAMLMYRIQKGYQDDEDILQTLIIGGLDSAFTTANKFFLQKKLDNKVKSKIHGILSEHAKRKIIIEI